jgi:hypothetical protein
MALHPRMDRPVPVVPVIAQCARIPNKLGKVNTKKMSGNNNGQRKEHNNALHTTNRHRN